MKSAEATVLDHLFWAVPEADDELCQAGAVRMLDDYRGEIAHALAEKIRAHTTADYPHVLAAYGSAYANGWRFGRDRAADLVEEGETT